MKKTISLLLLATLIISMSACNGNSQSQNPQTTPPAQTQTESAPPSSQAADGELPGEPENTAVLIADFSNGSSDLNIEQYELGYSGELTPEILLDGLTKLTGLDFIADVTPTQLGILVDWKNESTLIANLDGREQKEEFHFFDSDTMRWFMMDSLYRTLIENFGEEDVFYSMDGERELEFEQLHPVSVFPINIPYMGSPFYFNHADGRGFIYNEDEASDYLLEKLTEAGYVTNGTAVLADPDGGDSWFGDMAVWYFDWGLNTSEKFTAEKHFAITYDWEMWEYNALDDEWSLWN